MKIAEKEKIFGQINTSSDQRTSKDIYESLDNKIWCPDKEH